MNRFIAMFLNTLCLILTVLWLVAVCLLLANSIARADEGAALIREVITAPVILQPPAHTLSLREDGSLFLDGKPIEALQHEEIKEILKEMAEGMDRQKEIDYLYRQTDYLLEELDRCQNQKGGEW